MATGGKRDPSTHRTPAQQRASTRGYKHRPDQIHKRSLRNAARKMLEDEGLVHKGDGKQVDHKKMLKDEDGPGANKRSNLRVTSAKFNDGWRRRE